tara:strand:- start:513 stop:1850 length:1338 start_codon:yes stop_codon:yes gene_type:complete
MYVFDSIEYLPTDAQNLSESIHTLESKTVDWSSDISENYNDTLTLIIQYIYNNQCIEGCKLFNKFNEVYFNSFDESNIKLVELKLKFTCYFIDCYVKFIKIDFNSIELLQVHLFDILKITSKMENGNNYNYFIDKLNMIILYFQHQYNSCETLAKDIISSYTGYQYEFQIYLFLTRLYITLDNNDELFNYTMKSMILINNVYKENYKLVFVTLIIIDLFLRQDKFEITDELINSCLEILKKMIPDNSILFNNELYQRLICKKITVLYKNNNHVSCILLIDKHIDYASNQSIKKELYLYALWAHLENKNVNSAISASNLYSKMVNTKSLLYYLYQLKIAELTFDELYFIKIINKIYEFQKIYNLYNIKKEQSYFYHNIMIHPLKNNIILDKFREISHVVEQKCSCGKINCLKKPFLVCSKCHQTYYCSKKCKKKYEKKHRKHCPFN